MCFHMVRKCTINERNLVVILTTHVDIFIVRAIDLQMENQTERLEAFKLIIWMLKIYEKSNLKKLIDSSAAQKNGKYAKFNFNFLEKNDRKFTKFGKIWNLAGLTSGGKLNFLKSPKRYFK